MFDWGFAIAKLLFIKPILSLIKLRLEWQYVNLLNIELEVLVRLLKLSLPFVGYDERPVVSFCSVEDI